MTTHPDLSAGLTPARRGLELELPLDLPPEAAWFQRNLNGVTSADYGPPAVSSSCTFDGDFCSQDFLVVGDETSGRYLLIGALAAERSLTYLTLERRQGRFTRVILRQPDLHSEAVPEAITIFEGNDPRDLILDYARHVADRAGLPPVRAERTVVGYCSWYYYYSEFGSRDLEEVVSALAAKRADFPCRYVQIDDGYQSHHGDWLERHPNWHLTLAETASLIRSEGFEPGIWLMPFLATTASRVFREHTDWFVKGTDGEPYVMRGWSPPPDHLWACLDASLPEVREHLAKTFRDLAAAGFTYFKLDGTGMSLPPVPRADPDATPLSAFRAGLRAIREAVPEALILGCGTPFLASLGLVDHVRVSPDTGSKWEAWGLPTETLAEPLPPNEPCNFGNPCLRNALHYSLAKWWMADRWFRIDPDALMARDERTSLSAGEARMSVLSGILTGIAITSDHPGRMSRDRLELLARAAKLRLRDARPLDWGAGRWPQIFTGQCEGQPAAAVFNDSDRSVEYRLDAMGLGADATEHLHPLGSVHEVLRLPPHDAALLIGQDAPGKIGS